MKTKYPALFAIIAIVTSLGKDFAAKTSIASELTSTITLVPEILAFIPLAPGIGAELAALKAQPSDELECVELLISECGFSNPKANAIIANAGALAASLISLIPEVKSLVESIEA